MTTITEVFSRLRSNQEGGLIAYVTAGDPTLQATEQIIYALAEGGADIIELGIPFSDPIADGPTIQAASLRALQSGTTPSKVIELVKTVTQSIDIPIVLMTYYNPILQMTLPVFFKTAKQTGVKGVIVPDLPLHEADNYLEHAKTTDIDTIFLATPATTPSRLESMISVSTGFLYLVSVYGVTGARQTLKESTIQLINRVSETSQQKIPVAVGFGLSTPDHVQTVIQNGGDAAIVGSSFVNLIAKHSKATPTLLQEISTYCASLKEATKKA